MKRVVIYINGHRASMSDLAILLERTEEILEVKRLPNGNIAVKTI